MKYKIIVDGSVDIDKEIVKKYNVDVLPIEVNFGGDDIYPEGLPSDEFYEKLKTCQEIPKTCQVNQYKFELALTPYLNKENWFAIVVVISSDLAGTLAQAKNAVDALKMKNAYVCDSRLTTFAQGVLIIETLKYINSADRTPDEVIAFMESLKNKIRLYAVVEDLKYLKHSGRIGGLSATVGTILGIKPIVTIENGKAINCTKKRGEQANLFMVEKALERDRNYPIYFGYTSNKAKSVTFVNRYADRLEVDPTQVVHNQIGCVIGSHVGPEVYGLVFIEK